MNKTPIPTGVIKTVNEIMSSHNLRVIVDDPTLRRNIAYTFQFIDFVDWLLYGTDVVLIAREQTIKYGIIAINSIIEGIVYDYLGQYPSVRPAKKLGRNLEKLKQKDVPKSIIDSLKKVHKKRGKVHLRLWRTELEYRKYRMEDYEKAKSTLDDFMDRIYKTLSGSTSNS